MPSAKIIEGILKKVGYIITSRKQDQSLQWSYISQAVIREIVDKYRFLIVFRNNLRIRSGKFNQPTIANMSVQWLLQAFYSTMQRDGKNVYIFPVSINYERLFEIRNLADMMVSGNQNNMGLFDIQKKFGTFKGHTLGRSYVMFGKTISLRDFVAEHGKSSLGSTSLVLTERLVVEHHLASPVFLNNLIASLLLQHDNADYKLDQLVSECQQLYDYFQERSVSTLIHAAPNKKNIERVLKGLGYKVVTKQKNAVVSKVKQVIDLTKK